MTIYVYCNGMAKTICLLHSCFAYHVIPLDLRYPNNTELPLQEVAASLASTRDSPGADLNLENSIGGYPAARHHYIVVTGSDLCSGAGDFPHPCSIILDKRYSHE